MAEDTRICTETHLFFSGWSLFKATTTRKPDSGPESAETYVIQWIPYVTPNTCLVIAKVSFQFSHTSNSGIMCDLCPEVKGWTINSTYFRAVSNRSDERAPSRLFKCHSTVCLSSFSSHIGEYRVVLKSPHGSVLEPEGPTHATQKVK